VHIGSQLLDLKATRKAILIMGALARKTKLPLEFLDVGGGLGVPYHPDEVKKVPAIADYMKLVHEALEEGYFQHFKKRPATRVAFEPGRRIIAQTGALVMSVLRTKLSEKERFMMVDGGMNDFMRPTLYGAFHALVPVKKSSAKAVPTHVVGPICETSDCFATGRPLPPLKPSELLVLADTGAYGYSMGSNYNLRGRPAELLVNGDDVRVINKAQPYEELR
jgi:diaminopimelate decarboxylase